MPVAVIFDMDGLIFDTEALYRIAFSAAAADGGHNRPDNVARQTAGLTWVQSGILLTAHFGHSFPVDQFFVDVVRHFDQLAAAQLQVKPGVVELLDLLDRLKLPRCIATSSSHPTVQGHLVAHGLADRFDAVVAHGDYLEHFPSRLTRVGFPTGRESDSPLLPVKEAGGDGQASFGGSA
jgi:beta-phosphoglucomutase-like phosphatase (HAD superfamily)